ncbi:hypothetical protein BsWGS_23129 [Bradybaena similaris]
MKPLLVLTCLCFIGAPKVYGGVSKRALDFVSYVNGKLDNENQTQQPGDKHALIQVRNVPVDIPCLRPNPLLFVEEASNRIIQNFFLVEITEGIEDTVSMAFYTFANQSNYKPGEYNVNNFSNMSCGDLQRVENCTGSFRVADGYVFGNFPECSYTSGGTHPRITTFYSCDSITATMSQNTQQPSPIEPFEFLYTAPKFPVINPPEGYVAPCGPKIGNNTNKTNMEPSA